MSVKDVLRTYLVVNDPQLTAIKNKIAEKSLDDIIDNDPIAEGIYERFVAINGVSRGQKYNSLIEDTLKYAYYMIAEASFDKHPEHRFEEHYKEEAQRAFGNTCNEKDVYITAHTMLSMCLTLPKNLERFKDCLYFEYSHWLHYDSIIETFRKLQVELRNENKVYLIEDLLGVTGAKISDYTTADWKSLTNGYDTRFIDTYLLDENRTPEDRMSILEAIEAKCSVDSSTDACQKVPYQYFTRMKKLISLGIKSDKDRKEVEEKTQSEQLKLQIEALNTQIAEKDVNLKVAEDKIIELNKQITDLISKLTLLSSENQDLLDSSDAKTEDPGFRTRKVTSAAIYELLKPALKNAGNKGFSFVDVAKLIEYFTNFSHNKIRTELSAGYSFNQRQADEIERVNDLFQKIGLDLTLNYSYN